MAKLAQHEQTISDLESQSGDAEVIHGRLYHSLLMSETPANQQFALEHFMTLIDHSDSANRAIVSFTATPPVARQLTKLIDSPSPRIASLAVRTLHHAIPSVALTEGFQFGLTWKPVNEFTANEAQIRTALNERANWHFDAYPFGDLIEDMQMQYQIKLVTQGIDTKQLITLKVDDLPVAQALSQAGEQLGFTFQIVNESLT